LLGDKRVIGVCITKLQDQVRADFVNYLYRYADKQQYKLMVFNSFLNFQRQDAFDEGAMSVYDYMNDQILDAVIIVEDAFADKRIVERLVRRLETNAVPVVIVNGRQDGCLFVEGEWREAFTELVEHLILRHGAREQVFFVGQEQGLFTGQQLACYRKVLEKNGLTYRNDRIFYDCDQTEAAKQAALAVMSWPNRPRAIVCGSDYIAFVVCSTLHSYGFRVPEDVIVTGFGGVPTAAHFSPRLTTCNEDLPSLAARTLAAVGEAIAGHSTATDEKSPYKAVYAESCGCTGADQEDLRGTICHLYRTLGEMGLHEDDMYSWMDQVLGMEDVAGLYPALSSCVLENSCVCLDPDLFTLEKEQHTLESLLVIPSADQAATPGETTQIDRSALVPDLNRWAQEESLYIISAIYAGSQSCGYYAVKTNDPIYCCQKIKRVLKTINIAINAALKECRQRSMLIGLEQAMLTDPISGLPNVKGAQQWFEAFSEKADNRNHAMAISVYAIPKYSYIYEHYGIQDVEELLTFIGKALRESHPADSYIAHIADNEFVVINSFENAEGMEETVSKAAALFSGKVSGFNDQSKKAYYLEVNNGYSIIDPGWSGSLESFVKYAVGEMYLNRMRSGEGRVVKEQHSSEDYYSAFNLLVEKNLFTYHFQPIVDARTGNVYAYEALMRTSGGINMSPLDVLEIARKYDRLYEIEKATLFNVMRHYVEHYEEFGGHMLFINTIPGHFLNEEDCEKLMEMYGEYMDHVVFELTEQNTISDKELQDIRRLGKDGQMAKIAVDDYGTGHSNMVNLLRYAPQVIKIDRYLISEIQNDTNKQMFVKNTIEFARLNGIQVLAEGVETFDELQTVIEYGMDLVQGYYLGRPIAEPVPAIQDQVKNEIVSKTIRLSKLDSDMRAYTAKDGEVINLLDLAINKFTFIDVFGGQVTLVGEKDHTVDMVVRVADNVKATLVFQNANFKGATETTVQIGTGSQVKLVLEGDNTLYKEGIRVPATSSLLVEGDGNLSIIASRNDGVGIGANYNSPYGSLTFDVTGRISVDASGDKVVCIGGGKSVKECIHMINGTFDLEAKGISIVGLGSANGNADIRVDNASVKVHCAGDEAVCMGSISGRTKLRSTGNIEIVADSEQTVCIGSLSGRESELHFTRGKVKVINRCYEGVCIGSREGSVNIFCTGAVVDIYAEGTRVAGTGSMNGRANTIVSGGTLSMDFLVATVLASGNDQCQLTVNGGNVLSGNQELEARNLFGTPLHPVEVAESSFEKQIDTELGSYIYRAQRDPEHAQLVVYLPEE